MNPKWHNMKDDPPPLNRGVIVYSDVFDNYGITMRKANGWKGRCIPAMSHWREIPKPPWWCYQCMGIPRGQMIQTHMGTTICTSCGRDIEKEAMPFEKLNQ